MPRDVMTQAPIPLALFCSGDGDFWKEFSSLTDGPLHSIVDRLQQVIMLDKALSIVKAYIAAFKRWHRSATELKRPSLPAKAPHVALFSTPPGTRHLLMRSHETVSRRTSVDARKSRRRRPDKPPYGRTAMPSPASPPWQTNPPQIATQPSAVQATPWRTPCPFSPCRSTIPFKSSPHYAFPVVA